MEQFVGEPMMYGWYQVKHITILT